MSGSSDGSFDDLLGVVARSMFGWGCLLACAASLRVDAQAVRDSAGIRIVHSASPAWTPAQALRLSVEPLLTISERSDSQQQPKSPKGAARLKDGSLLVADAATFQLRVYSAAGKFVRQFGERGTAPGQFQEINGLMHLNGDTVAVLVGSFKLDYFTGAGAFLWRVGSQESGGAAGSKTGSRPMPMATLAAFADGSRVVAPLTNPEPRKRGEQWIATVLPVLVARNNDVLVRFGPTPMLDVVMEDNPRPPWFGRWGSFANSPTAFYAGFGDAYRVRVYSRDGQLRQIISRAWTPVAVTKADIASYEVEWGKRWIKSTGALAEEARADLHDDPYAKVVPSFSQLIVGRDGRLWVREPHLADAPGDGELNSVALVPSVWSVFEKDGKWLGDVTMPAGFKPYEIGADYVLGARRGAERAAVVLYSLKPSGTGRKQ